MLRHCSVCHRAGHDRRRHKRNPFGLPFGASHRAGLERMKRVQREYEAQDRVNRGKPPLTGRKPFKALFGSDTRGLGASKRGTRKRAYTFEEFMAAIPPSAKRKNPRLKFLGKYRCRLCGGQYKTGRAAVEHINKEHGGQYRLHPEPQGWARRRR